MAMEKYVLCLLCLVVVTEVYGVQVNVQKSLEVSRRSTIQRPIGSDVFYDIVQHDKARDERMRRYKQTVTNSVYLNGSIVELGYFFTHIQVGTPEITVPLLIDTGSSTLTVPTAGCKGCGKTTEYSPKKSKTSKGVPCSDKYTCNSCTGSECCSKSDPAYCGFHIQYGEGYVQGSLINDTVCFEDHCATATIGAIEESKQFGATTTGILGLAFYTLDCVPSCITPLFTEFVDQRVYDDIFALCLTNDGGVMDLGYWNPSRAVSPPVYVPIILQAWYVIPMKGINVGGVAIDVNSKWFNHSSDDIGSFVDSGATLVYMHPQIFNATRKVFQTDPRYAKLPGINGKTTIFSQGPDAVCVESIVGYPTLTFVLDGMPGEPDVHLELEPHYYMLYMPEQKCYSLGFQPNIEIGVVLGDVFIQSHYVIFDRKNSRLGFAPIQNCKL